MKLKPYEYELDRAGKYLKEMGDTNNLPDFEDAWQNFLSRISKVRELSVKDLQKLKGFQQWYKQYKHLIENDPLLVYMHQARNAETHTLDGTIDRPFNLIVQDKIGRPFQINGLKVSFENGTLIFDIDTPDHFLTYDVKLLPGNVTLKRVRNFGKTYDPPKTHLKNDCENLHPVVAAQMTLAFYRSMIQDARLNLLPKPSEDSL